MVQIHSPRPFFIFCPLENQVERLSVSRPETYTVRGAVQKHSFQQLASFRVISRKVQRMRLLREFKSSRHGQYARSGVIGRFRLESAVSRLRSWSEYSACLRAQKSSMIFPSSLSS
jgi:hypothetical protein